MADIWMDGFDHYGTGEEANARLTEGVYASTRISEDFGVIIPTFGARNGDNALVLSPRNHNFVRRVTGADLATAITSFGFYISALPEEDDVMMACAFGVSGVAAAAVLFVQSDGQIEVRGPTDDDGFNWKNAALLGSTTGPVISAGSWHHIEVSCTANATAGAVEIRVGETTVLNVSTLDTGSIDINQMFYGNVSLVNIDPEFQAYDDIILRDTTGSFNNDFEGDLAVGTLVPISNGSDQGWAVRPVIKLDIGVMNMLDNNDDRDQAIAYDDDAVFELGAGDYAVEGFFRWNSLLTGTQEEVLLSKWSDALDLRSWRLHRTGPDVGSGNELIFTISTDGLVGTETDVHTFSFTPELYRWYHIAVSRDGTDSRLFVDGQQIGTTATDANTYFDGAAQLFVNNQHGSSSNTPVTNLSLDGWYDGVRLTVGDARYTANFTPPIVALVDDANTELLLNFDDAANIDDSSNAFVGTLLNSTFVQFPDDGVAYQTVGELDPEDANFVIASLVNATGIIEFTSNPSDSETVTLGDEDYTMVTSLTSAFDVLIGADAQESLDNLEAAVNLAAGAGTTYSAATTVNLLATMIPFATQQAQAIARTPGTPGNTVVTAETLTSGVWNPAGGFLAGGLAIPDPSEFVLSQLPAEVTAIKSVAVVVRAYKQDSGSSGLKLAFIENGGASQQGSEHSLTENNRYWESIFNSTNGGGQLTPSDLIEAEIEIDRVT